MERNFAVPYNHDPALVSKAVTSDLAGHIYEFYGTDNEYVSGRVSTVEPSSFTSDIKLLAQHDIKFNYLFNGICLEPYVADVAKMTDKLKYLRDIGVTVITAAHPIMLDIIKSKDFDFEINGSVNNFVSTVDHALALEQLGYDRILIAEDELRNLTLIKDILDSSNLAIEVMINNTCARRCVNRISHQSINSQPGLDSEKVRVLNQMIFAKCKKNFANFLTFLKASWIRPEDMYRYVDIGVKLFKITGRLYSTDTILQYLKLYATGTHRGNILDYLSRKRPINIDPLFFGFDQLDAEYVDDYFEHVWNNCQGDNCQECQRIADMISKKIEGSAAHTS